MEYFKLLRRTIVNTFNAVEYRRWWAVPMSERLLFGIAFSLPLVMLLAFFSGDGISTAEWLTYSAVVLLVELPVSEYFVEKLKVKHERKV